MTNSCLRPTRLGFGSSSLAGVGSASVQQILLGTAYDEGIRHFDTAPYYGSGDAETILGRFLATKRSGITVTTKYGLASGVGGARMRLARQAARKVFQWVPGLKSRLSKATGRAAPTTKHFSIDGLGRSVDVSLANLGVESIDFLMLHDWPANRALADDVMAAVEDLVQKGKVRVAGVASSVDAAWEVLEASTPYQALQFEHSLRCPATQVIGRASQCHVFTHRALAETFSSLQRVLSVRPGLAEKWTKELGVPIASPEVLAAALMEWALRTNPAGTILFSARSPDKIRKNAAVLRSETLGESGAQKLEELFARIRSTTAALNGAIS